MAKPSKAGTVVKADFGNGEEYAILVDAGDDKDTIVPLGKGEKLGYREPSDPNNTTPGNTGRTWWKA